MIAQADAARNRGACVAVVTADGGSPLARMSNIIVEVPCAPFVKPARAAPRPGPATVQPGGALFEQSLLIFYDGLILDLADRLGWSPRMLKLRHSNLE